MPDRTQEMPKPICPKCGYDQSGIVATWEMQCPLTGTCPECGLNFNWPDIFDPSRIQSSWYIEHARSIRAIIKRSFPTTYYLAFPSRFWKRIRPDAEIRIGILILWSTPIMLIGYAISTILLFAAFFLQRYRWGGGMDSIIDLIANFDIQRASDILSNTIWLKETSIESARFPYDEITWWWNSNEFLSPYAARATGFAIGSTLMWGLILAVIPTTRSIAKIRYAHITRAIILSLLISTTWFNLVRAIDAINWSLHLIYRKSIIADYIGPALAWIIIAYAALWPYLSMAFAIRKSWAIRPSRLLIVVGSIGSVACSAVFVALMLQLVRIIRYG